MNVIFLDFDGVIYTGLHSSKEEVEKRIKLLGEICQELDCKVVIEAAAKYAIDEETMEVDVEWINHIFYLFNKYGIDCIGRTPTVEKRISKIAYLPMWKEDEIRLYLFRHPEIDHYCVIDDDDTKTIFHWNISDLDKVRDHLVQTIYCSNNPEEEGLLPRHKEEIKEVLKKENEVKRLALRRKNKPFK